MRSLWNALLFVGVSLGFSVDVNAGEPFINTTTCQIPQQSSQTTCDITVTWHGDKNPIIPPKDNGDPLDPANSSSGGSDPCLYRNGDLVDCAENGSEVIAVEAGTHFFVLRASTGGIQESAAVSIGYAAYTPQFSWNSSSHKEIVGDFDNNGKNEIFVQPILKTSQSGLFPQVSTDQYINNFHRDWNGAHPQISAIEDWSQESYGAYVGDFNSNPGKELLLLGNKNIILLHGDIITPIVTFPQVNNAIVSWDASRNAFHTEFEFDANPEDFEVVIGDLTGDGYDEIFLQGKSKGSTSYVLSNSGALVQTLSNGYLNIDWSAAAYSAAISGGRIQLTPNTSADDYNETNHNTSTGAVTSLQTAVTKPTIWGDSPSYVVVGQRYVFTPSYNSNYSVSFSVTGAPSWMSINSATGEISGVPSSPDADSKYNITLNVYENKSHSIPSSMSFTLEVSEEFSVVQTDYDVYRGTDGTLYLVSSNGTDVYAIIEDNGNTLLVKISRTEFDSIGTALLSGYQAQFFDQDLDGAIDLVLIPQEGSDNDRILIGDINGTSHIIKLENFVESAPEIHQESIPEINIASQQTGAVAGAFRVDESGASTYSVPLVLPEGTGGVKPELALVYSSSARNGLLGLGWNLSGLSAITRCKQTQETDNTLIKEVDFTLEDRFCLDGSRLIAVNGNYGEDRTEYATEINSFRRIISYGSFGNGPAYFTVESKDGSIQYYGNTSDSRAMVNYKGEVKTTVSSWALNKTIDRLGNYVEYKYINNNDIGEMYVTRISYTGNSASQPALEPYVHIHFDYTIDRPDKRYFMQKGSKSSLDKRLERVRVLTKDANNVDQVVKRYELGYEQSQSNDFSLLNSIEECSGEDDNTCLNPTSFTWQHGSNNYPSTETYSGTFPTAANSYQVLDLEPMDFNGDGKMEVLALKKIDVGNYRMQAGFVTEDGIELKGWNPLLPSGEEQLILTHIGDFDGNGNMDVLAPHESNGSWSWRIFDGTDNGLMLGHDTNINFEPNAERSIVVGDVDGDGLPDLIEKYFSLETVDNEIKIYPALKVYRNEGGTFSEPLIMEIESAIATNTDWNIVGLHSTKDINNDGRLDVIFEISCETWLCNGQNRLVKVLSKSTNGVLEFHGFTESQFDPGTPEYFWIEDLSVDVNGDGIQDRIRKNLANSQLNIYIEGEPQAYTYQNDILFNAVEKAQVIDYNQDGRFDIVYPNSTTSKWEVALSNGTSFEDPTVTNLSAQEIFDGYSLFQDFNGDGYTDHLRVIARWSILLTFFEPEVQPRHKITKIENGVGEFQEIFYKALTDESVYKKGDGAESLNYGNGSQVLDLIAPIYVVSDVVGSAPTHEDFEATTSINYRYQSARVQAGGRGFLGFEKILSTDNSTGIMSLTKYRQDFPFIGSPIVTYVGLPTSGVNEWAEYESCPEHTCSTYSEFAATKIKETKTDWKLHTVSDGRTNFPYLEYSEHNTYLGGAESITKTTQTVDDYNNVLTLNESVDEVRNSVVTTIQTKVTTNQYQQDEVSTWTLGRLTDVSVTTSRPNEDQSEVPPVTRESSFTYNSDGMLIREVVNPNGGEQLKLTTAYEYDSNGFGNVVKTTQCSGHIAEASCGISTIQDSSNPYFVNRFTRSEWDAKGRFVDRTYNALEQKMMEVNSRHITGQPTQVTNLDGVVIDKAYDAHGRLYFERSSLGSWTKTLQIQSTPTASAPYALTSITTESGAPAKTEYFDILGRSIKTVRAAFDESKNIVTERKYDLRGRLHAESHPYFEGESTILWTEYQYDLYDRNTLTTFPNNLTSSVNYTNEYAVVFTNQIDQTRTDERNALGELTGTYENGKSNLKTTYLYDALGELRRTIDIDSIVTAEVEYDVLGRKVSLSDRDSGTWTYNYNALGELVSQTDAKFQTTSFKYDKLGRMTRRTDVGNSTSETFWYYDSYNGKNHPGKLIHEVDSITGFAKSYDYDSHGRLTSTTTHIPATGIQGQSGYVAAKDYVESVTYDQFGRIFQQFDASGNESGIRYVYDDNGFIRQVRDARHSEGSYYYQVNEMDAWGNITRVESGNGIESVRAYDKLTGLLQKITTGSSGEVQALEYNFNAIGRLEWRESSTLEGGLLRETFGYDGLNRLTSSTVNSNQVEALNIKYDENGNIKKKSDVSTSDYSYTGNHASCSSNPNTLHAVKQIGDDYSFCYDSNGNQTKLIKNGSVTRSVDYSHFNKPLEIQNNINGHTTSFQYGTDRSRYMRIDATSSKTDVTHYLGSVEVHYKDNGGVEFKRSIGGRAIVSAKGNDVSFKYLHKDYQGSITAITDSSAQPVVVQRMSFDPFGKRRKEVTWEYLQDAQLLSFDNEITTRGYTGHEMLDEVGIIHMNGRTYDAHIGRFMQADIAVQDPGNGQNLNRYSYVLNSPMSYTDPSGYFYYRVPKKPRASIGLALVQVGFAIATNGASLPVQVSVQAALGYVTTGNIRGAASGAFTALMFYQVGNFVDGMGPGGQAFYRGLAGGVSSVLQGGKFGHGFVSSAAVSLAHGAIIGSGFDMPGRTVLAAIVGGTVSEITGGSFANGAVTAAFQWAFNYEKHKDSSLYNGNRSEELSKKEIDGIIKSIKAISLMTDILGDKAQFHKLLDTLTPEQLYRFGLSVGLGVGEPNGYDIVHKLNIRKLDRHWRVGAVQDALGLAGMAGKGLTEEAAEVVRLKILKVVLPKKYYNLVETKETVEDVLNIFQ